jgi:hypothetical protein
VRRGHHTEAKRGQPCGPRITRNCAAMVSWLLPCSPTALALLSRWCLSGAPPRGQQGRPILGLSHRRSRLSALLMAVVWTFRRPSLCRHVHRSCMRNEVRDLPTIVPATACHQRNDLRACSRYSDSDPAPCPLWFATAHVRYVDTTRADTKRALYESPRVPPPYGPTPRCADHSRRPPHTLPGRRVPVANSQ